nr:hypothetical protein BV200_01436 [Haemophilus influenzae]
MPPVAFKVKSLFIKKPTFVEPVVSNLKLDPFEALRCLEFIITPGVCWLEDEALSLKVTFPPPETEMFPLNNA